MNNSSSLLRLFLLFLCVVLIGDRVAAADLAESVKNDYQECWKKQNQAEAFAFLEANYNTRFDDWQKAAGQGIPEGQVLLAMCYYHRDNQQAIRSFLPPAEQGYAEAQYMLGFCYERAKQPIVGYGWWCKAASQKYAPAVKQLENVRWSWQWWIGFYLYYTFTTYYALFAYVAIILYTYFHEHIIEKGGYCRKFTGSKSLIIAFYILSLLSGIIVLGPIADVVSGKMFSDNEWEKFSMLLNSIAMLVCYRRVSRSTYGVGLLGDGSGKFIDGQMREAADRKYRVTTYLWKHGSRQKIDDRLEDAGWWEILLVPIIGVIFVPITIVVPFVTNYFLSEEVMAQADGRLRPFGMFGMKIARPAKYAAFALAAVVSVLLLWDNPVGALIYAGGFLLLAYVPALRGCGIICLIGFFLLLVICVAMMPEHQTLHMVLTLILTFLPFVLLFPSFFDKPSSP